MFPCKMQMQLFSMGTTDSPSLLVYTEEGQYTNLAWHKAIKPFLGPKYARGKKSDSRIEQNRNLPACQSSELLVELDFLHQLYC